MILYCWEHGAGLGHLAKFVPLARRLAARGLKVACALRDLSRVHEAFAPGSFPVYPAPVWLHQTHGLPEPALSYPDLLLREGWLSAAHLKGRVHGWRNLLERLAPRVIVCDYAPGAMLAARGLPIRVTAIGNGFYLPPAGQPMSSYFAGATGIDERLAKADALALASANHALAAIGAPPLARFAELFEVDERFLVTVPELDHYAVRRGERYWGTLAGVIGCAAPRWPSGEGDRVLVYLEGAHPWLPAALAAIEAIGARAVVYAPGVAATIRAARAPDRCWFSDAALDMAVAGAECDAAVLAAGHGAVATLLHAGKPLVLLPTHAEQAVTARNAVRLGVAVVPSDGPPDTRRATSALQEVLRNPNPSARAREFAARYAAETPDAVADRVAERIAALAAG